MKQQLLEACKEPTKIEYFLFIDMRHIQKICFALMYHRSYIVEYNSCMCVCRHARLQARGFFEAFE